MKSPLVIRPATIADVEAITSIYNEGIADRVATLETEERSLDERLAWLNARTPRTPVFVAEREKNVLGWAALNLFNPRSAYRFVADFSIYIDRESRGQGIGRALLDFLIESAKTLGYHKLVLAAFSWNEAGMGLYHRAGFREVGHYRQQGVLDGKWVDTVIMELLLDDQPPPAETEFE
jgi:L-amino acid N-acyltransferase YncA